VCIAFLCIFVCNIFLSEKNWARNWDGQTWQSAPKNEISWVHILMKCTALVYVSNTKQTVWDLWWTEWYCDRFFSCWLRGCPVNYYLHQYCMCTFSHLPPMLCVCSANTDVFAKCNTKYILLIDQICINHKLLLCGTSRFSYPISRVYPRTGHEDPDGE
jgi:hypothetical protein